jgi:hypothetical protein
MYAPATDHAVAITVVPGPGIAPQISYHIRGMIARAAVDELENRLRAHLGDPTLVIAPN